jgi:hypothetical protein
LDERPYLTARHDCCFSATLHLVSVVVEALCDEVIERNSINLILPAALGLGFSQPLTGMSTRSRKIIMFLGSKVRTMRRADNLAAICDPIV